MVLFKSLHKLNEDLADENDLLRVRLMTLAQRHVPFIGKVGTDTFLNRAADEYDKTPEIERWLEDRDIICDRDISGLAVIRFNNMGEEVEFRLRFM